MLPINSNSTYSVVTNHEVSTVLSRLNSDEIIDTIKTIVANKYKNYPGMVVSSNIVASYEVYCKNCKLTYPDQTNDIMTQRNETLADIIDILLKLHHLQWIAADNTVDIYSIAYYLYDFLVTNFNNYVIGFFIRYITREKDALCAMLETMGISINIKKIKDLSTVYSKTLYNDSDTKMTFIHANMDIILNSIITFDISFDQFIADAYAYHNLPHIGRFLTQFVSEYDNFFATIIKPYVIIYLQQLVTDIKLTAQYAVTDMDISSILINHDEESEVNETN